MKKFQIKVVFAALFWLSHLSGTVNALVLNPGETQFVKEEDVTCSLGNTAQFAKVYYGCRADAASSEIPLYLSIDSFNSKGGLVQRLSIFTGKDGCKSQLDSLKKYKSTIGGITEVSFCARKYSFAPGKPQAILETYVFAPAGTFSPIGVVSFPTLESCIQKANALNASKGA